MNPSATAPKEHPNEHNHARPSVACYPVDDRNYRRRIACTRYHQSANRTWNWSPVSIAHGQEQGFGGCPPELSRPAESRPGSRPTNTIDALLHFRP